MRISDWSSDVCSSDLDDVLVGSGASTPAVVNLTASTIFGKKAAGGASALSPSEARTVLGLATTDSPHFAGGFLDARSEEHTSELQSLMRISYAVFCLKKKK